MGVHELWTLLLYVGRRIHIETLEGQILAVDASIWMTQFLKAMRNDEGQVLPAAHLKGFFSRICRLKYYGIKPVFVFDGATPEIKKRELQLRRRRREQFQKVSDQEIHRQARRILTQRIQELKMNKNSAKSSAFSDSFNLGGQERKPAAAMSDDTTSTNEATSNQDVDPATAAAIQEIYDKDEAERLKDSEQINDWDGDDVAQSRIHDQDSDSEEDIDNDFDLEQIASLPLHQRKDAIERAKRQQRLRSRREFMPAAADPLSFSQVQLTNFLRTSKINKDIEKLAKKQTKDDSGEYMASDRNVRVILRRDDDSEDEKERRPSRKRKKIRFSHEDSSDEEVAFDEGQKTTNKALFGDSSDEEAGVFVPAKANGPAKARKSIITLDDSDNESDEPKVPNNGPSDSVSKAEQASHVQDDADFLLARALQTMEDEGFQEDAEGNNDSVAPVRLDQDEVSNGDIAVTATEDDEDDENIDWEEGEGDMDESKESIERKASGSPVREWNEVEIPDEHTDEKEPAQAEHADDAVVEWESGPEMDDFTGDDTKLPPKDGISAYNNDTDEILQRGQKAAERLTNWAGREYRRAMKQAKISPKKVIQPQSVDETRIQRQEQVLEREEEKDSSPLVHRTPIASTSLDVDSAPPTESPEDHQSSTIPESSSAQSPYFSKRTFDTSPSNGAHTAFDDFSTDALNKYIEENDDSWKEERKRRERDADTVTDEMKMEIIELLQLFGIPYIEAPSEAEAQCAALEQLGLVQGCITEDSDVFVFGGRKVYKNIFDDKHYAEAYYYDDIEREMCLNQNSLCALAMLLGCDYTSGVKGVGPVHAMEILSIFDVKDDTISGLQRFKEWLEKIEKDDLSIYEKEEREIMQALISGKTRWELPANFPSDIVAQAFLNPVVDKSTDRFSWGSPDVEGLMLFCSKHIGWRPEETKRYLDPIIEKMKQKSRQTRLDSFMKYEDGIKFANVKSAGVRNALSVMTQKKKLSSISS